MAQFTLDIVIPIYNEESNLPELKSRITTACKDLEEFDWRVIYVNDGSSDSSLDIVLNQRQEDPRFALLDLSRNFGHQSAISAGLLHADADAVVIMDGDLQYRHWSDRGEMGLK